ncbi:hypothetical protein WICMUC_005542 [Wickerhamomyces mucosus]|uniref:Rho-GAP domain-containing protein n=1 Tax=Wickerhamomyces mucosus TaxID=1378264 RepID=A0A9P8T647_9ASCO|nr:hypothetical protein WICMUC_005542 [Wickerhamomyces mucosus]
MASFADSFWTDDYTTGIEVLFSKLNQGCIENQEFINLFTSRMEYEYDFGKKLVSIPQIHQPLKSGFGFDDGASLKNAFKGISIELSNEGDAHLKIADSINGLVLNPFSKWAKEHKQRVNYSEDALKSNLKVFKNKLRLVEKLQKKYYNKCRAFEDLKVGKSKEELLKELSLDDDDHFTKDSNQDSIITLGNKVYTKSSLTETLAKLLTEIPKNSIKVPILGKYDNVTTGSQISTWLQKNLGVASIDDCERFGQDLISNGFLRKLNTSVGASLNGSGFVNSGAFHYQWKDKAFKSANIPIPLSETNSVNRDNDDEDDDYDDQEIKDKVGNVLEEIKSTFEEPSLRKLNKEVKELDENYSKQVLKLDKIRCDLEELIIDHLTFMEKCELDRLRALKKVILDFSASVSQNIPSIQAFVDNILLYEESISPDKDLLFLLQNYKTGKFKPNVILYDNYYENIKDEIFGVDLITRCKNDKKSVPLIVSTILSYLDNEIYPNLPNDEIRVKIWLIQVKLKSTHELRFKISLNKSSNISDILRKFPPEVVISVLKLYLLELPNSLIPGEYYDLIKSIYLQFGNENDTKERINGIINVLKNLDRSNLSTLNSILTHFHRLLSIIKEKDSKLSNFFKVNISSEFSNLILRPKQQNNLNLLDNFNSKFIIDLISNKSQVFKSLKSLTNTNQSLNSSRNDSLSEERDNQSIDKSIDTSISINEVEDASIKNQSENRASSPDKTDVFVATEGTTVPSDAETSVSNEKENNDSNSINTKK